MKTKILLIGTLISANLLVGCAQKKIDSSSAESINSSFESSIVSSSEEISSSETSKYINASSYKYTGKEDKSWAGIYRGFTSNPVDGDKPTDESFLYVHSDGKGTFVSGDWIINISVIDASKFNDKNEDDREIFFTDDYSLSTWSLLYKAEDEEWAGSVCGFFTARYEFIPYGE